MNAEKILRVAQAIEDHEIDLGFNMSLWHSDTLPDRSGRNCGTTACIGGWTEMVFKGEAAQEALGLTTREADQLFYAMGAGQYFGMAATAEQAVAHLRSIAETKVIEWNRFVGEGGA